MMPHEFMVVLIVFIACGTGVAMKALELIFGQTRQRRGDARRVEAELAALREEIAALKTGSHDVILSFESTLHQLDARLQSVERRALAKGVDGRGAATEPEALEARGRV